MDTRFIIQAWDDEVTSFVKDIRFNYEGTEYKVFLYWDTHDGYDIKFRDMVGYPEWYLNWDEVESIEYILDSITEDNKDKKSDQLDQAIPLCGDHIRPVTECGCKP